MVFCFCFADISLLFFFAVLVAVAVVVAFKSFLIIDSVRFVNQKSRRVLPYICLIGIGLG